MGEVLEGERLSLEDGVRLFESPDFTAVGRMADHVKTQRDGDRVYFVLNRHLNPTNICALSCSFCDFAKKKGDPDAYEMSMEEILGHVDEETREVHIVGATIPTGPSRGTWRSSAPYTRASPTSKSRPSPPRRSTTSSAAGR